MSRMISFSAIRTATSAVVVLASCLPKDVRPEPGSLEVTITADPLVLGGSKSTSTSDGWTVSYDRFLIAASASLGGDTTCASYYTDGYRRILSMEVAGPQRLNLLYALGHCDFSFRVASSDPDPLQPLGQEVTPADQALMSTAGVDPYTTDRAGNAQPTGIAMYVKGSASKGAETKTFTWSFRQRVSYQKCAAPPPSDGGSGGDDRGNDADVADDSGAAAEGGLTAGPRGPEGIDIVGGDVTAVDIRVHGESLFLDSTDPAVGRLRFDTIAAADDRYGDHDGEITLSELRLVPLHDIAVASGYRQPPPDPAAGPPPVGVAAWTTLEDFVYLGLVPKVARFEDHGSCVSQQRGR